MTKVLCGLRAANIVAPSNRPYIAHSLYVNALLKASWSHHNRDGVIINSSNSSRSRRWQTTSTAIPSIRNDKINGPISTLPAPLDIPQRAPNESLVVALYKRGRGYLTFYKSGLKNIYRNYTIARNLRRLIRTQANNSLEDAVQSSLITRSDHLLLYRSDHDISRLPPFALLFLVCGEFTPLVVPFVTSIVPLTCRIPSQIESQRNKQEARRRHSFRNLVTSPPSSSARLDDLKPDQILHISRSLDLHSRLWPDNNTSIISSLSPIMNLLKSRIRKRIVYLDRDDWLIQKDGTVQEIDPEELRMALVERGVDVMGRSDAELRAVLAGWLKNTRGKEEERSAVSYHRLFLTRPSVWQQQQQQQQQQKR